MSRSAAAKSNGSKVRRARRRLALTQLELAVQLGVSRKTVSRYENGHPVPARTVLAIKHLLNSH